MVESAKYIPVGAATVYSDFKSMPAFFRTRRTMAFAYGFIFAFMCFTAFLILNPTAKTASPWFTNIISSGTSSASPRSYRSHFSTLLIYFIPNSSQSGSKSPHQINFSHSETTTGYGFFKRNANFSSGSKGKVETLVYKNKPSMNITANSTKSGVKSADRGGEDSSLRKKSFKSLANCDFYDGNWVKDVSYPLYKPGSCSLIDEQFNCINNGRPDKEYNKLKWKPRGCALPRLNGGHMLKMLTGKRLVFVGDSLNRNMWESLVCVLRNSAKNPRRVFEAYGRHYFRTDASYSFIFADYNCSIEFFVSPFLVQEWEVLDKNGSMKETLRLDLVGKSSDQYKGADVIIFNTGHWWTHEKTSKGLDYYQEGSHVYGELNVLEAFRRALTTWRRWVDANINPNKTRVFYRGYSASHFSGGQWNSGGQCDSETKPIRNETYLSPYPQMMTVLESVLQGMRTPVTYLNVTRMTDYRKDAHPSIYRKSNLSAEELKSSLMYQDCSHWCLPGVPDAWNELVYAELLRYRTWQ